MCVNTQRCWADPASVLDVGIMRRNSGDTYRHKIWLLKAHGLKHKQYLNIYQAVIIVKQDLEEPERSPSYRFAYG